MNTCSINFPSMFDVARNRTGVATDSASIVSRVKLLLTTEPTELYMNPTYGVGLKRYLFQYNNDNIVAEMRDRIVEQLRIWEPCVDPDKTTLTRGLDYTGEGNELQTGNVLNLTLTVYSIYGEALEINL